MGEAPGNRRLDVHGGRGWRREGLRSGFTTGACAAAAAAAATRALLGGEIVSQITIQLPTVEVTFPVQDCTMVNGEASCSVVKDAGDDPDVTHGLHIAAYVRCVAQAGLHILGGEGVGRVTLPGLPVAVGEPAINPGPLRIIRRCVEEQMGQFEVSPETFGLQVTISVPEGRRVAEQTMNPRLGIVDGISILGTNGIVRPYSHSAYRISIHYELKVAREQGLSQAVLASGRRSEEYARRRLELPDGPGSVEVGDHVGYALGQASRLGFERVVLSTMVGKLSKLAQGRMQTHASQGAVDFEFLADVAAGLGAGDELLDSVRTATTAHQVQVILKKAGIQGLEGALARRAAAAAYESVGVALQVEILVFSMGGELIAREVAG